MMEWSEALLLLHNVEGTKCGVRDVWDCGSGSVMLQKPNVLTEHPIKNWPFITRCQSARFLPHKIREFRWGRDGRPPQLKTS